MSYKQIVLLSLSLVCVSFQLNGMEAMEEADGMDLEDKTVANKAVWTPLHCAAWRGDLEEVRDLVEKGANINAPDYLGNTSYHLAAASMCYTKNPALCQYLKKNGGNENLLNYDKMSPWGIIITGNPGKGLSRIY